MKNSVLGKETNAVILQKKKTVLIVFNDKISGD